MEIFAEFPAHAVKYSGIEKALIMEDNYKIILLKIIDFLKQEKSHKGVQTEISPSWLLDKIAGMCSELPEIRERIFDE